MPKYVKVQGTWRAVDESADCGKVKVNGVWRTVTNSYVKVGLLWKSICSPATTTTTTTTTTIPVTTATTATTALPYPNIGSVTAYGAGAGQVWTTDAAYVTWGGSGWGSYTVVVSNGSSFNSPSSAGGPPVLITGLSAGSSYSVTVTLYANANYSGASASASTSFTTASGGGVTTVTTTAVPSPVINSMTESSTCTTITIAWTGSNYQSWAVTNSLGWTDPVYGNGAGGSVTLNVGTCGTTKTATLRLYSGLNQTGSTVSQAFTISTTSCSQCTTTTTSAATTTTSSVTTTTSVATTATAAVFYCSGLNTIYGPYQFTDNYDATGSECDFYSRVCSQLGYPAYPTSVPTCPPVTTSPVTTSSVTTSPVTTSSAVTTSTTAGCQNPLYGSTCTSADLVFDLFGWCTSAGVGACSFGSGASCLLGCLD